jgi:hypothetical protein
MAQYNLLPLKDLARGLDLRSAESNVADGYCEDLSNVDTVSSGQLAKRKGYQGYAGWMPMRIREVSHDGYQINFKLAQSVDLSGLYSSPIVVYGKLPQTEFGDFNDEDSAHYYSGFSVDVRDVFTNTGTSITKTSTDHSFSTSDLFVYTLHSTTDSDSSNTLVSADAITIDSVSYDVTVDYAPAVTERVYIMVLDKSTDPGSTWVQNYAGASFIAPVAGVITGTITAATHGLGTFNIIPKLYDLVAGDYIEFVPDSLTIDDLTGDVTFRFNKASNFTGKVILDSVASANYSQLSAGPGATATLTIPDISTNFPYWAVYRFSAGAWEMVIPDDVSVDDSTDSLTITIQNSSLVGETYEIYYDFATIAANTIRVLDTSGTSTSYTGTTVTTPQLTMWGISHEGRYDEDSSAANVLHLDSYKRDLEARLVAGLGGNLYTSRTRSEVGDDYLIPQYSIDLDARIADGAQLAPLFQNNLGTQSRTRGSIKGDNVSAHATVDSVTFVSANTSDYHLSITAQTGTLALGSQVSTDDYLTVQGMAHEVNNGSFRVVNVTDDGLGGITFRVTNPSADADLDETGAEGEANVFTDVFTTTDETNYIAGDEILADSIGEDLTVEVIAVDGDTVIVSGVTEQVDLAQGLTILGRRTAYAHPMRNTAMNGSVRNLVCGDMVTVLGLTRQPRIVSIHPFQDMNGDILIDSGSATVELRYFDISSVDTATDKFTSASCNFGLNDPVMISTTASLPAGLRSDTVYYYKPSTFGTFQLMADEDGTVLDLTTAGSGVMTVTRVHNFAPGQRVTMSQTGDPALDGVRVITSVPSRSSFTYATDSLETASAGVVVGRTVEFDEELTFTDSLSSPTTVTVNERWIPIEAPTARGGLAETTYVSHFDDTDTTLRSVIVGSNMYFVNGDDEVMKFDGENLYQAGLFRWQPQLFAQVDTSTPSLTLDDTVATVSAKSGVKFTVGSGESAQFRSGDRIVHSNDGAIYTVNDVDTLNNLVFVTASITGSGIGTIKKVLTYKYYFRMNAIDANNNVIAGAVTGSEDFTVELTTSGQIKMRLVGMPAWGMYDYNRIELEVYRTLGNASAVFYKIRTIQLDFDNVAGYIDVYDGSSDDFLLQVGDLDETTTTLLGSELGNGWQQPPRAKYITAVNNRLVLANVKDYQQIDVVIRKKSDVASLTANNLHGARFLFYKDVTNLSSVTTNMTDRVGYELTRNTGTTITALTGNAGEFTITAVGHPFTDAGQWAYIYHPATGTDKGLQISGWWQVASILGNNLTFRYTNEALSWTLVAGMKVTYASDKNDVPVYIGTDGNQNTKQGNFSASFEYQAAYRLSMAINATMTMCDREIEDDFVPYLTAAGGNDFQGGQCVVRTPKNLDTSTGLYLSNTTGATLFNYEIYVNSERVNAGSSLSSSATLRFPSRVVISYENYPETFDSPHEALSEDSDSVVDVNSADGEEITGVIPFFGESAFGNSQVESLVVVFKTNSIYLLDVKTRSVQKIDSQGLGCTAPFSIASTRNGIMFANLSGVYRLNRNLTVTYAGKMIERYWRDVVNTSYLGISSGHNYGIGRQYKLSVPVSDNSSNSVVLVYDHTREGQEQEYGAWTKYTNHPATGWASLNEDSYFATTTGQVFKIRTANDATDYRDDAAAVDEMVILMKSMDAGLPGIRKRASITAHVRMDKTDVTATTVEAAVDNSTTFESAGTIDVALATKKVETFQISLPTPRWTYMQLKFRNSVKDENFVLAGLDLYVTALSNKGVKQRNELPERD